MKTKLLILVMLLSLNSFSQTTKAQRYEIYKSRCNFIDTITLKQSGFLKFDTLVVKSLPVKPTYYGKVITSSIKISPTRTLIEVVDTIWTPLPTSLSYMYGLTPKTTVIPDYNKDYKRWVYRNKKILMRRCKPVSYTIWTKNELYYSDLLTQIETNIKLIK